MGVLNKKYIKLLNSKKNKKHLKYGVFVMLTVTKLI